MAIALFALRQAENRDTHLSPYKLVFGRLARTPLDILLHINNVKRYVEEKNACKH